jgi:hypothetical protein
MLPNGKDNKIELINFKLDHKILFMYLQLSLLTPETLLQPAEQSAVVNFINSLCT